MRQKIAKEIAIGLLIGLISNAIGVYLYLFFLSGVKKLSIESTFQVTIEQGLIGNIIILGALLNLAVFFIFLKKKKYYRARGVILATLIAAIVILVSKFF